MRVARRVFYGVHCTVPVTCDTFHATYCIVPATCCMLRRSLPAHRRARPLAQRLCVCSGSTGRPRPPASPDRRLRWCGHSREQTNTPPAIVPSTLVRHAPAASMRGIGPAHKRVSSSHSRARVCVYIRSRTRVRIRTYSFVRQPLAHSSLCAHMRGRTCVVCARAFVRACAQARISSAGALRTNQRICARVRVGLYLARSCEGCLLVSIAARWIVCVSAPHSSRRSKPVCLAPRPVVCLFVPR